MILLVLCVFEMSLLTPYVLSNYMRIDKLLCRYMTRGYAIVYFEIGAHVDSNIELIKTVLFNTHTATKLRALSEFYAPDFTYKSPLRGYLNFEEHCQHLASIKASSEFEIVSISNANCCYEVELDITIIHSDSRKRSKLSARANVFFKDGIIQRMTTSYNPTAMQLAYILKNTISFTKPKGRL